jgi:hypothetical protein
MALTANDVVTPLEKLSLSSFSNGLTNDTEVSDHFCDRSCLLSLACTCEVSLTHNLDHRQENLTLISLPNEILDVIALYLRASDKIRSLSVVINYLRSDEMPASSSPVYYVTRCLRQVAFHSHYPRLSPTV